MEDRRILAVFQDDDEVRITVPAVPRAPRSAALIFGALGRAGICPHLAEQRPGGLGADRYELALIVARSVGPRALAALEHARGAVGCGAARCEAGVGRLLLLGADLRSRPEVTARLLAALDDAGVRFEFVSAAADRVCLVIRAANAARALDAVRDGFGPTVDQVYFSDTSVPEQPVPRASGPEVSAPLPQPDRPAA